MEVSALLYRRWGQLQPHSWLCYCYIYFFNLFRLLFFSFEKSKGPRDEPGQASLCHRASCLLGQPL